MRDIVFEKIPDSGMRMGEIYVASPDPVVGIFFAIGDQAGRLRVVDDHVFGVERKAPGIFFVIGAEDFKMARLRMIGSAMQSIVESLGNFEEIFSASHNFPTNVDSKLLRDRNKGIQDFGDPSANGGGIDHDHRAPDKRLGECAEFGHLTLADDGRIVIQWNLSWDLHRAHAFSFRGPPDEATWRARCRACWCRYQCD